VEAGDQYRGDEVLPHGKTMTYDDAQMDSETDAETEKNDLYRGLVRMGLLLRLRYLLRWR
jgi:hypothetical protein